MRTNWRRGLVATLALGLTWALAAPAAHAATLYVDASPGVNDTQMGVGACQAAPPTDGCNLQHAVETIAMTNDNVMIAGGNYVETDEITLGATQADVDLIGAGSPATTISSSAPNALNLTSLSGTASVRGLQIVHSGSPGSALVLDNGGVADRVSVHTSTGESACRPINVVTLQNSVCRNTNASGAAAVLVDPTQGGTGGNSVTLTNVTAYATGASAKGLHAISFNGNYTSVVANNSIFRATGAAVDVSASNTGFGGTDIQLDYSDYADIDDPDASTTITPVGSLHNITGIPSFDSPDGNFHQAAGSPTIDKGSAALTLGSLDIDGQARNMGLAPDIGADEFVPPAVEQPPDQTPNPTPIITPLAQSAPVTPHCRKGFKLKGNRCVRKRKKKP